MGVKSLGISGIQGLGFKVSWLKALRSGRLRLGRDPQYGSTDYCFGG